MKIRKEFRVESAHIVRNCTSERCSHSYHGHSAVIEVFLEGRQLDNAGMLYDFGLMKGPIKEFIDSMDHCSLITATDDPFSAFIKEHSDRWIELPFNPSAENLSRFIMCGVNYILSYTIFNNGEDPHLRCTGVRYHETTTGWAECNAKDLDAKFIDQVSNVKYSKGVMKDWSDNLKRIMSSNIDKAITNPKPEQQVKFD